MTPSTGLLSAVVQGVTFRSQITPPYRYDPNAPAPPADPASGWLMQFVKPAIDIETPGGPVTFAPYGEPTQDYYPLVAVGGIATLVGIVVLIGWLGKKLG